MRLWISAGVDRNVSSRDKDAVVPVEGALVVVVEDIHPIQEAVEALPLVSAVVEVTKVKVEDAVLVVRALPIHSLRQLVVDVLVQATDKDVE